MEPIEVEAEPITLGLERAIEGALAQLDPVAEGLAELRRRAAALELGDPDDAENEKAVRAFVSEVVSTRTGLEALRKELKQPALDYGRALDARAKEIEQQLREIEAPGAAHLEAIAAERKRRREEAEAERQRLVEARYEELRELGFTCTLRQVAEWDDEAFEEALALATTEHEAREQARREREAAEAAERAERERREAAQKAEFEKLQAALAEERAAAQREREAAEARIQAALKEQEAARAELQRKQDELERREREAREAKEAAEREEARREALAAAERDRLRKQRSDQLWALGVDPSALGQLDLLDDHAFARALEEARAAKALRVEKKREALAPDAARVRELVALLADVRPLNDDDADGAFQAWLARSGEALERFAAGLDAGRISEID